MTAALAIPELPIFFDCPENTVSSENSNELKDLIDSRFADMGSRSVTWERGSQLIQELLETFSECSTENWDGYEALPMKQEAVLEAVRFVANMPILMPDPDIVPEPSGDIGFQWSFGEDRILTVSFEGRNILTYAAILGSFERTKYGKEYFNDSIPQEVVQGIEEISSSP